STGRPARAAPRPASGGDLASGLAQGRTESGFLWFEAARVIALELSLQRGHGSLPFPSAKPMLGHAAAGCALRPALAVQPPNQIARKRYGHPHSGLNTFCPTIAHTKILAHHRGPRCGRGSFDR